MNLIKNLRYLVAVAILTPVGAFASPVQIDSFITDQTVFATTSPGSILNPPGAIGDRTLTVVATGGSFPSGIFITENKAAIGYGPGVTGSTTLEWAGFPVTDFSDGGLNNAIGISILNADSNVSFKFTVQSNTGTGTYTRSANGAEDLYFLFAGFSSTVDFTQVTGIALEVSGGNAFDATFDLIEATKITSGLPASSPATIPLPAGVWLMIGGVGALVALRRRKRAAA